MPRGSLETLAADADFPALRYAADHDYILSCLSGEYRGVPALVREIDVLNHKPGRRCTVRYAIEADGEGFAVVGKWYRAPGVASSMHTLMSALLGTDLSLPPLVYGSDDVVIQRFVSGRELRDMVADDDTRPFSEAGRWLSRLHAVEVAPGLKAKSLGHELAKVAAWCRELSDGLPELAGALQSLQDDLMRLASSFGEAGHVPIHRDYYPANLLWDGATLWAVDFDQMAFGDPAMDAGTFLAQLEKIVIRDGVAPAHLAAKSRAFADAYRARRDDDFEARLAFFTAYTFLKVAEAEVKRQRPRWRELTHAFLLRAREEAARG